MRFSHSIRTSLEEHHVTYKVLLLGLLTGLIYLFIIPSWQHYDEPAQFEYAWLIANRPSLPVEGDYDQMVRREVAASMVENDFFRELNIRTNLVSTKPIWIGISQIGELPLYYWLASLPLRWIRTSDVSLQLIVLRFTSLMMFLVTILAAYGIACELTNKRHPLRWILPASIALLPSFVDIMTAVNDDVGAIAFFSVFLWIGTRMILRGFNWLRFLLLVLFAVGSFWTKNTVVIAVILAIIPILFSIFRGSNRRFAWFAIAGGALAVLITTISWGDAAIWYRSSSLAVLTRYSDLNTPLGKSAIAITIGSKQTPPSLYQIIPRKSTNEFRNKPVSIGAWIWANRPATVRTPMVINDDQVIFREVQIDENPKFFLVTSILEASSQPLIISLSPLKRRVEQELIVYYDGVVLTDGNHPQEKIPEFNNIKGKAGIWDGNEFTNVVRNPSGEETWPLIRSWADILISRYFPGRPSLVLASILDFNNFRTYYATTSKALFQSFWARFGWGNVTISGFHPYSILGIYTLIGIIGAILYIIRNREQLNWGLLLFLGLPIFIIWGFTLARGVFSYLGDHFIVPMSRYAYPAVIPTMLVINMGWLEIGKFGSDFLKIPPKVVYIGLISFLIVLNIVSIYSILRFFHS